MRVISKEDVNEALNYAGLIEKLREAFRSSTGITVPLRHHHTIETSAGPDATILLMPAWTNKKATGYVGVKVVSVFPGNANQGLPAVLGSYLLSSSGTGQPLAVIDGTALTLWRTACASALASDYLSRSDAAVLLMVGAGSLASHLIQAHMTVRPSIRRILIWNRTHAKALELVACLSARLKHEMGYVLEGVRDLEAAVCEADIISCATLSCVPLVKGEWLKSGSHLDLVGAYRPDMREADDDAVRKARLFVDTRDAALKEGGDLVDPISRGVISPTDVVGDLSQLTTHAVKGRESDKEITLFKSVGFALEDLIAAQMVYEHTT